MSHPMLPLSVMVLCAAVVMSGCTERSGTDALAAAKSHLARHDLKAAIIEAKNALQRDPALAEARFLLGTSLLDSYEPEAAEDQLRRARELNYPAALVMPELARALLAQGKYKLIVEEFSSVSLAEPGAQAELQTALARAYVNQSQAAAAESAIAAALAAVPNFPAALLVRARLMAGQRDVDGAFVVLNRVLASSPEDADAWILKGDLLLRASADRSAAAQAYRTAVSFDKTSFAAHSALVLIDLTNNDVAAAEAHVEALRKVVGAGPSVKYLEALLAFRRGDGKAGKDIALQLLQRMPDNTNLLVLAGSAELEAGAFLQARKHFDRALLNSPGEPTIRQLLAQLFLRTGKPADALAVLQTLLEGKAPDAATLRLAGEAYLQLGQVDKAEDHLSRSKVLAPNDVMSRTGLALARLSKNQANAFDELAHVAATDAGTTADLALIASHLKRKQFERALEAIGSLERKQPSKPLTAHLEGVAHLGLGHAQTARQSFERALRLDPGYFPSVVSLANLDLQEKKPAQAKQRYQVLLQANPKNVQALLGIADFQAKAGAGPSEVASLLADAVKAAPTEITAWLRLIGHHTANKQPGKALLAAQDAVAALPNEPLALDAVAQAQWAAGDSQQALRTYAKLASLRPDLTIPHLRMATIFSASKDNEGASRSLRRALTIAPDLLIAQQELLVIEAGAGRLDEAVALARTIQTQRPKASIGFLLEGDIEASRKNWRLAETAFRSALARDESGASASKLHALIDVSQGRPAAQRFADRWLAEHPRDAAFAFYLGDLALSRGDFALAEARYRVTLKIEPDNAPALNNTAWVMVKLGKPGAVALAEKANALLPNQPALMETLAVALDAERQTDKALGVMQKAVGLLPDNHGLRLDLAKMYIRAGHPVEARAELDRLSKAGSGFSRQSEVEQVRSTL